MLCARGLCNGLLCRGDLWPTRRSVGKSLSRTSEYDVVTTSAPTRPYAVSVYSVFLEVSRGRISVEECRHALGLVGHPVYARTSNVADDLERAATSFGGRKPVVVTPDGRSAARIAAYTRT